MSSNSILATVTADAQALKFLADQTELRPDERWNPCYGEICLQVTSDGVVTLGGRRPESPQSYCSFGNAYFDDIQLNDEPPVCVIMNVEEILSRLDHVSSGTDHSVTVELRGQPRNRFASQIQLHGGLHAEIMGITSNQVVQQIPFNLQNRFDAEGRFYEADQMVGTNIETSTTLLSDHLIRIIDYMDRYSYPLEVTDGDLCIDAIDARGNAVTGILQENVSSEDFCNYYGDEFARIVGTLDGDIELQTADDAPLAVLQQANTHTLRHVVHPVQPPTN